MSCLAIYNEQAVKQGESVADHAVIANMLADLGVRFERWEASQPLSANADQNEVLKAYAVDVERLNAEYGFQSVDVVSLRPDNPNKEEMRRKFLSEHTHGDFEVRFFVDGKGLFYLHAAGKVYVVLCEQGDLISVPANTTHWFDMGANPDFKCIRLFTVAEGWVGEFTGSELPAQFPDFDAFVAEGCQ